MNQLAHKIGDRVVRPKDVYKQNSPLLHGEVICVYGTDLAWPWMLPMSEYVKENKRFGVWRYPELYKVRWDDGSIGDGYFDYGISPEIQQ